MGADNTFGETNFNPDKSMKIRPEELRIGNLLQLNPKLDWYPGNDLMVVVESISGHGINFGYYPETGLYWKNLSENDIVAIPLTEEWLIRGGFEVGGNSSWLEKGILAVSKSGSIAFKMEGKWVNHPRKMGYVHDIQNLWKSLTGEELKFNDQST